MVSVFSSTVCGVCDPRLCARQKAVNLCGTQKVVSICLNPPLSKLGFIFVWKVTFKWSCVLADTKEPENCDVIRIKGSNLASRIKTVFCASREPIFVSIICCCFFSLYILIHRQWRCPDAKKKKKKKLA